VIVARERETRMGDDISSLYGLGADRPALAWPMTIAMLSLAGFPATVGFFGKLYLIQAVVDNDYAWLGVVIVLGSAISLVYYLRVVAAVWMRPAPGAEVVPSARVPGSRPAMAGGSPEGDAGDGADRPAAGTGAGDGGDRPGAVAARRGGDDVAAAGETARPAEGRRLRQPEVVFVAIVCAVATVAFGIYPDPLFDLARDAGAAIASLV